MGNAHRRAALATRRLVLREPFGLSPYFDSELTQYRWDAICDVMQGLAFDFRPGIESEDPHKRLMSRLDRSEVEFDFGAYVDGSAFLDALLERYDA